MQDLPQHPPLYDGVHVETSVSARVAMPAAAFSAWFAAVPLEQVLPGVGLVPATIGAEPLRGVWNTPGARRRVLMADGSTATEEVLTRDADGSFTYILWGFKQPLAALAHHGRGSYRIVAAGPDSTDVTWTYAFAPKGAWARPLLGLLIRLAFRPFMVAALARIQSEAASHQRNCAGR